MFLAFFKNPINEKKKKKKRKKENNKAQCEA
jgi:hypothetical protein